MAYSEKQKTDILNKVCKRIIEGEAVRNILKEKDMPDFTTWLKWMKDEEKAKQYAHAMELRAEHMFEEILKIADTPQDGITIKETERGTEITKGDMIQHRRLQIDARKFMLAKMMPKKYGDRIDLNAINTNLNVEVSDEQREKILKDLDGEY